jgi:hypothetical protein
MLKKFTYPQYRKYSNGKSFFKIISTDEFEEIQLLGTTKTIHHFKAKILPDRNYVYDLITNENNYWLVCEAKEYESLKETIHKINPHNP